MTTNAGIWIDHHKAIVVLLSDDREEMLQIVAESGAGATSPPGLRGKNSYMPNDFVAEDKRERKVMAQLNSYYDRVIACVRNAQAILIMGPGAAKGEFRSRIARQKVRGHVAEMKTVDKLADQEIADYVRQHFQ